MGSVVAVASNEVNLSFFLGIAVFWLHGGQRGRLLGAKTAAIGASVFLATGLYEAFGGKADSLILQLSFAFGSCLAVLSLLSRERYGQGRLPRALVRLGVASYSIYLCHVPVLYIFSAMFNHDWVCRLPGEIIFVILMIVIGLAGLASYRFLEAPLLRGLHRLEPSSRPQASGSRR